ncbi:MAG TPA: peptidase inhibitor family I36 protein [Actinomycetota bacterium]|nr:peptidase inhibitor family I36 protein [Actinomycetota bacterium]
MFKKQTCVKLLVLSGLIATTSVAIAAPASAACDVGRFCAFDGQDYVDKILDSGANAGTSFVDVADNQAASAKNRTGQRWCGVESNGWPDQTVFSFAQTTWYTTLGSANNTIDHFYVRGGTDNCD